MRGRLYYDWKPIGAAELRPALPWAMRELTSYAVSAWHNVELSNPETLRVDLLGETSEGGLLHVELQSSNDTRMALRMFEYCLGVYRQHGCFPEQVVLYMGEAPLNMPEGLEGPGVSFRYRLMDIRQFDGGGLLESEFIEDNIVADSGGRAWSNRNHPAHFAADRGHRSGQAGKGGGSADDLGGPEESGNDSGSGDQANAHTGRYSGA